MFRTIQIGTNRPVSYPVDPNATFQAGQIAQLKVIGNDVVMGVSDGTAPFGIIDDVKDTAFVRPVIDEIVIIEAPVVNYDGYNYTLGVDTIKELGNANLIDSSFVIDYPGLSLNPINGVILAPTGSVLNHTLPGSMTPNAIRAKARYSYFVPNIPGEDSTLGSSRVTVWMAKGIFQTDQFEMVPYAVNATLYVSENGKLTAEKTMANQPGIAMVVVPPTGHSTILEFMWF
jgi:hypothetical protein